MNGAAILSRDPVRRRLAMTRLEPARLAIEDFEPIARRGR